MTVLCTVGFTGLESLLDPIRLVRLEMQLAIIWKKLIACETVCEPILRLLSWKIYSNVGVQLSK
ncbi:MAG: hypothetical protein CM1200mP4_4910 [Rhodospirillaceae bacterium]|nr:MAG: hypothetical protein CM1200mP4_4910 [Rhodospirillaceae bacterium]